MRQTATFQALIQQQKAISLSLQRLEPVLPSPTEQKQCPLKRVYLELTPYQAVQAINHTAQVCVSAGDVD